MAEHLTIPGALEWDSVERHSIATLRYAGGKEHDVKYVSEVAYDAALAREAALRGENTRLRSMDHRQILAESAAKYLLDSGAENFIGDVFTIEADDGFTKFEVIVTTQKVGAKSPGELCNDLKHRATVAENLLQSALSYFTESGMPEDLLCEFKAVLSKVNGPTP